MTATEQPEPITDEERHYLSLHPEMTLAEVRERLAEERAFADEEARLKAEFEREERRKTAAEPGAFGTALGVALSEIRAYSAAHSERSQPAFQSATALLDQEFPKTPWLVQGVLVERAVSVIGAEPKVTKTWVALELALAVASGTPAFGQFDTGPAREVAVFLVEDDERSLRNRMRSLAAARGSDRRALGRVSVKCRGRLNLESDEDLAWLVASCRALPALPALVVLDPLRDLHTAKENEADSMGPVMARLRVLRDLIGCAIVFVHHAGKATEGTIARRPGQRLRGSSVVHASLDGGLYLSGLETDGASWWTNSVDVELKSVRGAGHFTLRLDVTDDENGEAVKAVWMVSRREATKSAGSIAESFDEAFGKVRAVLKAEHDKPNPKALVIGAIREQAKMNNKRVCAALAQLALDKEAVQLFNGKKSAGWLYLPKPAAAQQTDAFPSVPERSGTHLPIRSKRSTPFRGERIGTAEPTADTFPAPNSRPTSPAASADPEPTT